MLFNRLKTKANLRCLREMSKLIFVKADILRSSFYVVLPFTQIRIIKAETVWYATWNEQFNAVNLYTETDTWEKIATRNYWINSFSESDPFFIIILYTNIDYIISILLYLMILYYIIILYHYWIHYYSILGEGNLTFCCSGPTGPNFR